jgi:predicted transcriptional regulator
MAIKYVGNKTVYDENGNEIILDMIQKNFDSLDRKGWRRVIIGDLLEVLDTIGNKKIKILEYLIDNMNSNNEINVSQDEVCEALNISKPTVNVTFKALTEANVLKKLKRRYVLNTKIISAYGSKEKNTMLCIDYGFYDGVVDKEKVAEQEQLQEESELLKL